MPDEDDKKKMAPKNEPDPKSEEKAEEKDPKVDEEVEKAKDELSDKLDTPGALEVEDMPESGELVKRREQTKKRLKELAAVEEQEELEGVEGDTPFETGGGGLAAILKEANLSPRFCLGGVIVVVILFLLIFGGIKIIGNLGDGEKTPKRDKEVVREEGEFTFEIEGDLDPSVYSGLLVGTEIAEKDIGTEIGEELGELPVTSEDFVDKVVDFTKIYNSLQVDVLRLLDQSRDREATLNEYLDELKYFEFLARGNIEQLESEVANLSDRYNSLEKEKNEKEVEFFEDLRSLDAYGSNAALDEFIDLSAELVTLKAEHSARAKLHGYYEDVLAELEIRIKEIELNREPIIKGIRVVDIKGADIELIIDESEF